MKQRRIFQLLLAAVLILSMAACKEKNADPDPTAPVIYRVEVVNQRGEPVKGALVQLCSDICIPGMTDEQGVAEFEVPEDDYKVSLLSMPEGYTHSGEEQEFLFEASSRELTVTLKNEG